MIRTYVYKSYIRGLQFSQVDGIQTEIDRHLQKSKFLNVSICLKILQAYTFKICSKSEYDPNFFFQNYCGVSKNKEFYVDFNFVEMGFKNGPGKRESQNFCRDIFWTQINKFRKRIKFRIFWCPIKILMGNFCVAILSLFANFESIRLKKWDVFRHLQTFKTYCFVNSFHFPFESFPFEIPKE
jgi:hypothetical protein